MASVMALWMLVFPIRNGTSEKGLDTGRFLTLSEALFRSSLLRSTSPSLTAGPLSVCLLFGGSNAGATVFMALRGLSSASLNTSSSGVRGLICEGEDGVPLAWRICSDTAACGIPVEYSTPMRLPGDARVFGVGCGPAGELALRFVRASGVEGCEMEPVDGKHVLNGCVPCIGRSYPICGCGVAMQAASGPG